MRKTFSKKAVLLPLPVYIIGTYDENGKVDHVDSIVVSVQHDEDVSHDEIEKTVIEKVVKPVLEKFNNILDDKTMANLNYQVESKGKKPEDVAREYLQEKGLLEAR